MFGLDWVKNNVWIIPLRSRACQIVSHDQMGIGRNTVLSESWSIGDCPGKLRLSCWLWRSTAARRTDSSCNRLCWCSKCKSFWFNPPPLKICRSRSCRLCKWRLAWSACARWCCSSNLISGRLEWVYLNFEFLPVNVPGSVEGRRVVPHVQFDLSVEVNRTLVTC